MAGLSDEQTMGIFLVLVFCQVGAEFCGAACFRTALDFGFLPVSHGDTALNVTLANRLMRQSLLSFVSKIICMLQIKFMPLHDTSPGQRLPVL